MDKTLNWFTDAGHGWLKVARGDLLAMGILDEISSYSYQRGWHVYLEEDCDAGLYIKKLIEKDQTTTLKSVVHNTSKQSKIRGYERFKLDLGFDHPFGSRV